MIEVNNNHGNMVITGQGKCPGELAIASSAKQSLDIAL